MLLSALCQLVGETNHHSCIIFWKVIALKNFFRGPLFPCHKSYFKLTQKEFLIKLDYPIIGALGLSASVPQKHTWTNFYRKKWERFTKKTELKKSKKISEKSWFSSWEKKKSFFFTIAVWLKKHVRRPIFKSQPRIFFNKILVKSFGLILQDVHSTSIQFFTFFVAPRDWFKSGTTLSDF